MSRRRPFHRGAIEVALSSDATDGDLAVFAVPMPPGGGPPMLHRHDAFELYRVRQRRAGLLHRGPRRRGDAQPPARAPSCRIAGGLEHTIRNESDAPAEALVVFSPGAGMERFAARCRGARGGGPAGDGGRCSRSPAEHGIEMTRPLAGTR